MQTLPLTKDLVLIGGGHAHALVLRKWGMNPMPGVRITVINPGPTAPYTGMMPGHVAGHYERDELEIDLVKLGRHAGARLVLGKASGLDKTARHILIDGHPPVPYDVASFDVGITAQMPAIPGFAEHAIGAKPLDVFAARWRTYLRNLPPEGAQIAVIGGGIAGVELALAMSHAIRAKGSATQVAIIEAGPQISGISAQSRTRLERALDKAGIARHFNTRAQTITADQVTLANGDVVPSTLPVGAAGAFPHTWVRQLDQPMTAGFIDVAADLRVTGHDDLFAVGDCAHMTASPRSKAGVFAVRSAPVLHDNFRAALAGQPTKPFTPQKRYLKLISLGKKAAIAERGSRAVSGRLLWLWKDRIDRAFMTRFTHFPPMPAPSVKNAAQGVTDIVNGTPLSGGCGAKVTGYVLKDALAALPASPRADVQSGPGDDAAIVQTGGQTQVISTDHLRAFTEDPTTFAEITALHALGDIWAMGAAPQVAVMNVTLPRMSEVLQQRTMALILAGAQRVLAQAGAALVGGHSTMGAEMSLGFTVTGLAAHSPITKAGAQVGDALILTRPLGTGVLLAGEMQMQAKGRHIAALLDELRRPQGPAAALLQSAHAMTDVTVFGLAVHLHEICEASNVSADIALHALPGFDGAEALVASGIASSLWASNQASAPVSGVAGPKAALLHDPQTAGGLLASGAQADVAHLLEALENAGYTAAQVGQITPPGTGLSARASL